MDVIETKKNLYQKYNNYLYYIIIFIVSLLSVIILPALGTEVGLAFVIPDTTAGWIVWTINKVATAIINVLIFHCFMKQAKVNIKDDAKYNKANEILGKLTNLKYMPMAPQKWLKKQYGSKATSIFFGTAMSTIGLTSAILSMNVVTLIVYIFTLVMGLIFGTLQMKCAEDYWTNEYYAYALHKQTEQEEADKKAKEAEQAQQKLAAEIAQGGNDDNNQQQGIQEPGRTSCEEQV